jgi:hypothetical protein
MTPTPNLPLLRKTLEFVIAHPEQYDQSTWCRLYGAEANQAVADHLVPKCGTKGCIAYHAVALSEGVVFNDLDLRPASGYGWPEAARRQLGLTHAESEQLFDGLCTWDDVWRTAEQIARRGGERLGITTPTDHEEYTA